MLIKLLCGFQGKYYRTKFAPPKKESKESKRLSANIQKFLQKRDQEEKQREAESKRKVADLLAMRDEKSKNKIRKMLKVTKSANKSVLDDTDNTPSATNGPEQLDQDDYGYVSNEANAFYQKYIEKVKDVHDDKGFAPSRPQSVKDLTGTKERVKAAITREKDEQINGVKQRSKSVISTSNGLNKDSTSSIVRTYSVKSSSKTLYDPEAERREEKQKKLEEERKKSKNRKPQPPPMDFRELLKLAEKKQHEPIKVVLEVKKPDGERLLTSKEKREQEEEKRFKEGRERRERERSTTGVPKDNSRKDSCSSRTECNGRIPKLNQSSSTSPGAKAILTANSQAKSGTLAAKSSQSTGERRPSTGHTLKKQNSGTPPSSLHTPVATVKSTTSSARPSGSSAPTARNSASSASSLKTSSSSNAITTAGGSGRSQSLGHKNAYNGVTREFPPRDLKAAPTKSRPPQLEKTRQFPPADVRRGPIGMNGTRGDDRHSKQASKRRIIDDDSEYDSEMADFIDDGDAEEDYSSHIKAIFGYDKSKYRDLDDEDDAGMESNFAQVQREEYISKKIGIKEDLEDMRLEAIEKKRKMIKKRKMLED